MGGFGEGGISPPLQQSGGAGVLSPAIGDWPGRQRRPPGARLRRHRPRRSPPADARHGGLHALRRRPAALPPHRRTRGTAARTCNGVGAGDRGGLLPSSTCSLLSPRGFVFSASRSHGCYPTLGSRRRCRRAAARESSARPSSSYQVYWYLKSVTTPSS